VTGEIEIEGKDRFKCANPFSRPPAH
jgi:hypothetical protein